MEPLLALVGKKIRALRNARKLTQPAVARAINTTEQVIGRIERGKSCSTRRLGQILDALNASPEEFFQEQVAPSKNAPPGGPHNPVLAREWAQLDPDSQVLLLSLIRKLKKREPKKKRDR